MRKRKGGKWEREREKEKAKKSSEPPMKILAKISNNHHQNPKVFMPKSLVVIQS